MLSCTSSSSSTLTRKKYQRVPQNLGNQKNGWTFGIELSIGSLTLYEFQEVGRNSLTGSTPRVDYLAVSYNKTYRSCRCESYVLDEIF